LRHINPGACARAAVPRSDTRAPSEVTGRHTGIGSAW
jgi:hypothetical protein